MQEKIKRQHTKKEVKLSHIEKWRQSGLSMGAYSSEAGISASNLSKWIRLENKSKEKFKPISLSPSIQANQNNLIEILIDQRIKIRLFNNTDPLIVANIVRSIMNAINN